VVVLRARRSVFDGRMTDTSAKPTFAIALREAVSAHGSRVAFRYGDVALSYARLGALVANKRSTYGTAGMGRSSTVGIVADDPIEFLTDVFALLELQAFCVLLPAETTHWELERLSSTVRFSHLLSGTLLDERSVRLGPARVSTPVEREPASPVLGSCIGFLTSGTTGRSKIALRTEQAMLAEAAAMRHELDLTPGRRFAAMVPVHHSFGFGDCALAGLLAGAEMSSYPRMPPSAYVAAFERSRIELVALVPPQLRLLAEASASPALGALSVLCGGAPVSATTARLAKERLGCVVGQVYGSSETGIMTVAPPGTGGHASVGKPSRHMELRLEGLPPSWSMTAPADSEGVVAVRSPALFFGYATLDGVDSRPVQTGWFSTGDCARWVDGHLELLGRLSSAINVAGVKVSAEEVEAALLEFPGVRNALVTGVDDALAYQRIKALVAPDDIDVSALQRFCEERLSPSKRPHYYEAIAAIPTTASGKVVRAAHR